MEHSTSFAQSTSNYDLGLSVHLSAYDQRISRLRPCEFSPGKHEEEWKGLTYTDFVNATTTLTIKNLASVVCTHPCPEPLLSCPFNSTVTSWVMHDCRLYLLSDQPVCFHTAPHSKIAVQRSNPQSTASIAIMQFITCEEILQPPTPR